jgi:hypothetical protein
MGLLLGSNDKNEGCADYISIHHNLLAHNNQMNPNINGNQFIEVINNIIYNYGEWPALISSSESFTEKQNTKVDFISNFFKKGINSRNDFGIDVANPHNLQMFLKDNFSALRTTLKQNEWDIVKGAPDLNSKDKYCLGQAFSVNFKPYPLFIDPLLLIVGAQPRDSVDKRIVFDVKNKTGKLINDPKDVGGWPVLSSAIAPDDDDHDGMPNQWELINGLNPNNNSDSKLNFSKSDFTNLEVYLNSFYK